MTNPMAASPTSRPVKRTSRARVRKTWVLGSRGGAAVVVVLEVVARVVVVANVVVCREVLCTDQLYKGDPICFQLP